MPRRAKVSYAKELKETFSDSFSREKDSEKENGGLGKCKPGLECENMKNLDLLKSPLKDKMNFKPLGFWSQKLKNLEAESSFSKSKKHGLYEFSGTETDESGSPYKKKKKVKRKPGPKKKRQPTKTNAILKPTGMLSLRKIKKTHGQSLFKEQIILNKEREKLIDKGKKFTFSTGMSSLGITSTPAVNKVNLVGASNFLFLSPIINEECTNNNVLQNSPSTKPGVPDTPVKFKTSKLTEKRISCRRVLRNGKIL